MSVTKLLEQADKLLEKGKAEEALAKLQAAFAQDPSNELAANKLARTFVALGKQAEAVNIYKQLGVRAGSSGKSQKAVALFRQGLEIDPGNLEIIEKLAPECEAIGKLSEAATYAKQVLGHYLPRKRYLDALAALALLARVQPNDEGIRQAWLELLIYVRLEPQLQKALVCLCGPPGISLSEFPVGGDPTKISELLVRAIENLMPFFPTDPVLPYTLAWVAYRQNRERDVFKFLAECFKRDQNFSLGVLLFGRVLSEKKRLEETLFVYKYVKEILPKDKSSDLRSLAQQLASFEEKNGWLNFADGFGGQSTEVAPVEFVAKFLPGYQVAGSADGDSTNKANSETSQATDIFAQRGTEGRSQVVGSAQTEPEQKVVVPTEIEMPAPEAEASMVIQFTGDATKIVDLSSPQMNSQPTKTAVSAPQATSGRYKKEDTEPAPPPTEEPELKPEFEATKIFSPLELLDVEKERLKFKRVKFHSRVVPMNERIVPPVEAEGEATKFFEVKQETKTVVKADGVAGEDQSKVESHEQPPADTKTIAKSQSDTKTVARASDKAGVEPQELQNTKTVVQANRKGEKNPTLASVEDPSVSLPQATEGATSTVAMSASDTQVAPDVNADESESADLGEDLLRLETKQINGVSSVEKTSAETQIIPEPTPDVVSVEKILQRAERYLASQNYYMARKSFKVAETLGASAAEIKAKLQEIRKLEYPGAIYNSQSDDKLSLKSRDKLLRDLEAELDIGSLQDNEETLRVGEAVRKIRPKIDAALNGSSPRVRLDLGVAFFEMGLFDEANNQFELAGREDRSLKREADYLRAQALLQKKDYPGAVSLLKTLCTDPGLRDKEKLPALYLLAEAYEEMQQPKRSKKYFEKVAELDSNYRSVRDKLESK